MDRAGDHRVFALVDFQGERLMANKPMTHTEWFAYLGTISAPAEDCQTCTAHRTRSTRIPNRCINCSSPDNNYRNYKQEKGMCTQNCNQGRACTCNQQHPNAEALRGLAELKPVQWWNNHDNKWMDFDMLAASARRVNPLISLGCKWRVKPEPAAEKSTYLTVLDGYTGQQTDKRYETDNVRFNWRWSELEEKYLLRSTEILK